MYYVEEQGTSRHFYIFYIFLVGFIVDDKILEKPLNHIFSPAIGSLNRSAISFIRNEVLSAESYLSSHRHNKYSKARCSIWRQPT